MINLLLNTYIYINWLFGSSHRCLRTVIYQSHFGKRATGEDRFDTAGNLQAFS